MTENHVAAREKLYAAILTLKTAEECRLFLDDLCTIKELDDLAQRFEVACLLDAGKNYLDISGETGASTATISRVGKCLRYGGGYRAVLARMKEAEK